MIAKKSDRKSNKGANIGGRPIVGLEAEPVSEINKTFVFLLIGIVFIILIFVLIDAFKAPKVRGSIVKGPTQQGAGLNNRDVAVELQDLPGSYKDAKKISEILKTNPKTIYRVSPEVENELSSLKSKQDQLKQELAKLQAKPDEPQQPDADEMQAIRSNIFPSGGYPIYQPPIKPGDKPAVTVPRSQYSAYHTQNMQADKGDFFNKTPKMDIYNDDRLQYPVSKYILQAGTVFPAVLQTKISSDLPGVVFARVRSDVYDSISGQYLLLPKGTKLLGIYNSKVSPGQASIQVKFQRLIRPDGSSIQIGNSPGINDMGESGITDELDNHWGRIIGSAALMTVFNIPAMVSQQQILASDKDNNNNAYYYSGAAQAFGQSASQVGNQLVNQALQIQPTITINPGKLFSAMVNKDIVIPPYENI